MRRSLLVILCLIFNVLDASAAYGPDNIVTINQTSSSGKTVILNKGANGRLQEKDLGVLLTAIKKDNKVIYKPVARLRSVKVFNDTSIWVAYKVFIPSLIQKDEKLILLDETNLLTGRNGLTFKRTTIVSDKKNSLKDLKEHLKEDSENLSVKEKNYRVQRKLHPKEKHFDKDIDLVDLDIWSERKAESTLKAKSFYKSEYAKEFQMRHRLETFEKMVVAFVRKYNDPKFTLARAYFNRDRKNGQLIEEVGSNTVYANYLENEEKQIEKESRIFSDLKSKGESWSDDYSDEELSELVYNVGIIKERERRLVVSAFQFDHQVYGSFGVNLVNNENLNDRENSAQSKYDFEFGYEYYAFKDIDSLKKFSFEFTTRRSVDAYSIGNGFNANSTEYSFTGGLNWYPFRSPNSLDVNVIYASIYMRTGVASLTVNDTNEAGTYSVFSLPGIRAGVKYNFSNSYGVRISGSFENIQASRIEKSNSSGVLPDNATYTDAKIRFGLSKFF